MKYLQAAILIIFLLVIGTHQAAAKEERARFASPAAVKERMEERREEAKERFAAVRDERKRVSLERIQNALENINERRTNHFTRVLERLSSILDKLVSRSDKLKAEGKDVSTVETQVSEARTAIKTAQDAVNLQISKDYIIVISDEATARENVGSIFKNLQEELRAVGDLVRQARTAVADVYRALAQVAGVSDEVELED